MEYANTFQHELSLLKSRVIEAIETNLKRIDRTLEEDDDEPIEFFSLRPISELDIIGINADGTLIGTKSSMGTPEQGTIRGYIEDDIISIEDAISLLEDLEGI